MNAALQLLSECKSPCLSLYQPPHRSIPERQQDPIRFKNLLRQLGEQLQQQVQELADELLQPLKALPHRDLSWIASAAIANRDLPGE